jgi:hypothetical protein
MAGMFIRSYSVYLMAMNESIWSFMFTTLCKSKKLSTVLATMHMKSPKLNLVRIQFMVLRRYFRKYSHFCTILPSSFSMDRKDKDSMDNTNTTDNTRMDVDRYCMCSSLVLGNNHNICQDTV